MAKNIEETKAHRVYGPYIKNGKVVWCVVPSQKRNKKNVQVQTKDARVYR